jgi:hypothetical protein
MNKSETFFYDHAGYSYHPATETPEQGRIYCATQYAKAEAWARDAGLSFAWFQDPEIDSSDFSDEEPAWPLWECLVYNEDGEVIGALGGVDFGRDGSPRGDHYRRVVEAELALEAMPREAA